MQPISAFALAAILVAGPALAQDYPRYPADQPDTTGRVEAVPPGEQEAQLPQEAPVPGEVETLRSDTMSAPNVVGEPVPEDPSTGVPQAGAEPRRLEGLPKP